MKKLIVIAVVVLAVGTTWYFIKHPWHLFPKVPTPTEVIQEAHEALPPMPQTLPPELGRVPAEEFEKANPIPKAAKKKKAVPTPKPRPAAPDVTEYETIPPVVHMRCLFPFNFIPNCEPAGINP